MQSVRERVSGATKEWLFPAQKFLDDASRFDVAEAVARGDVHCIGQVRARCSLHFSRVGYFLCANPAITSEKNQRFIIELKVGSRYLRWVVGHLQR